MVHTNFFLSLFLFQSVQSGVVSKGVGGGVMEDGTSHAPVTARYGSSSSSVPVSTQQKSSSLPGHYSRGPNYHHAVPQSFRDAFATSKSPTPQARQEAGSASSNAPAAPRCGPFGSRGPGVPACNASVNQPLHQRQRVQQQQHQHHQHQEDLQKLQIQKQQQQLLQHQKLIEQNKNLKQEQHKIHQEKTQPQVQPQQKPQKVKNQQSSNQKQSSDKHGEKKKRSILSGIFRRRKKEVSSSSSSSSSSDSEESTPRRSLIRRRNKKRSSKDPLPPPPPPPPAEENPPVSSNSEYGRIQTAVPNTSSKASCDSKTTVRVLVSNTGSLGREGQPLGIPVSPTQPGSLSRRGVSASHDSLPISVGSLTRGGSYASLGYYSSGGMGMRSSSTDTISKKEKREALKARVERLREKFRDTSSDEEKASVSSHSLHGSESSLCNTNSLTKRSRAARTERFLRRKSQELETLRTETEKDRRNREVVQARIQEIQRVREREAQRNKLNEEMKMQLPDKTRPRWSAKLVYQESSEYESSVLLHTPSASPAASPHMKSKFAGHIPHATTANNKDVIMRNKTQVQSTSATGSLMPPNGSTVRRSFQDFETPMLGDLRGHRSASFDSSINRTSCLMQSPYGNNVNAVSSASSITTNRQGLVPPAPPPRDRSRIVSPCDGRPMSFSFENINQEVHRPNSSQSSMSNFTKGSSPSPSVRSVPSYFGPKVNSHQLDPPPLTSPNRRSFSELQLSPQEQVQVRHNSDVPPARPAPPLYPNTQYRYTDQPPKPYLSNQYRSQTQQSSQNTSSSSLQYYSDQTPQYAKIVPISSIPPSPSSDYSSYVSDNSVRLQQVNTAWRQKEQELKSRISTHIAPQLLSDSSRSNSPKADNCHSNTTTIQSSVGQQNEELYGTIQTKSPRPPGLSLKQAESLSSLSGQSDVSSPVPKIIDSDSSQSSLAKEKKKLLQNRPLSMVLEKSESAEKESPPHTPKSRPQPPKRNPLQITEPVSKLSRRQKFQEMIKQKMEHPKENVLYQKEFEEMFRKEKERLERSKCNNFEEALQELEEIYKSLKLDNEDLLDGAERRDLPVPHQQLKAESQDTLNDSASETAETDSTIRCQSRPRTPRLRRSGVPDKKTDDMHYRRCQQSIRNQPDVQKALQMTGSYLLLSPAHTTPAEIDNNLPKDPMLDGEPDVVYDDVSYRNIKQANSVKVIDPQPPFGIPLGPTTQASPNDYLHVTPKENYRPKMIARKQPDTTMDDLAFRNLRKEQRDQSGREVNVSELDELLSEVNSDSPMHRRKTVRSVSADRARSIRNDQEVQSKERNAKLQTPRRVKHQHQSRRAGRFTETFKDAVTDSESINSSPLSPRHNPSWLERANLLDNKWENLSTNNLSTSTETLTEISSARAISQPDIRQAIIREARVPPGGPHDLKVSSEINLPSATDVNVSFKPISVPKLVKIQSIQSAPVSSVVVEKKPYRPLDSIFNNKPKPFYLSDNKISDQQSKHDPVDIAKLDALISTLSKIENNEETHTETEVPSHDKDGKGSVESPAEDTCDDKQHISRVADDDDDDDDDEKLYAKANIQKAIKLSMALESSSTEGKRISSRRRSAIDLPVRDNDLSNSNLSLSSTNTSSCLNVNPYSSLLPIRNSPERVNLVELPTLPVPASTFTDKIESMIVVSQNVHDRARRARSVPASPITVEDGPVFSKVFEVALSKVPKDMNNVDENSNSEILNIISTNTDVHMSTVKVEQSTDEHLSLQSNSFSSADFDKHESVEHRYSNADSESACVDDAVSSKSLHATLDRHENVEHVHDGKTDSCGIGLEDSIQIHSVEAPPPPLRSSSLPPSPALHRRSFASISAMPFSGPPSPTGFKYYSLDHRIRGASLPTGGRATRATSSDSDDMSALIRSGSLPPPSLSPKDDTEGVRDRTEVPNPGPHPCPSGEASECDVTSQECSWGQSLLAACYLLACLTQLAGVDIITAFSLILAVASMFVTFAI